MRSCGDTNLSPIRRARRIEPHSLLCARMFELQMRSVQAEPAKSIEPAAIHFVPDDGMPALGKVDANLMLSSGFQPHLQHRRLRVALQHAHVGDRRLASRRVLRRVNAKRGILRQIGSNRELFRQHSAFRNGGIDATGAVVLELILELLLRLFGLGKHQQTGRFAVQTMHDEDLLRRPFRIQVTAQHRVHGFCPFRFGSHRQQSRRFIDHNDAVVLEHDTDSIWRRFLHALLYSQNMRATISVLLILILPLSSAAWGPKGHFMVNRLAIEASASRLPPFMKAATNDLVYNALEPDRWREEADSAMNIAQAPDHFFDSEYWGSVSTLPNDRYAFMSQLSAKKVGLIKVGYLPYAIIENYARLRNAFRNYRNARTEADRQSAQANAVQYAGVLGHYVADATMPMHLSVHHNGWEDGYPNPRGFTKDRMFHSRYETAYVDAAISQAAVRAKVGTPQRVTNVFAAVKDHLGRPFSELETMYEMEKAGEFNPQSPRARGTEFITSELARGATMLGNLWYTAWVESGEPPSP